MENLDHRGINEKVRMAIEEIYHSYREQGYSYTYAKSLFISSLQFLTESEESIYAIYTRLAIYFMDYYAILNYKMQENTMARDEKTDYLKLLHLENLGDLFSLWKEDYPCLLRAMDASFQFSQMSTLGKMTVFQCLNLNDHQYLNKIYPTHIEDEAIYGSFIETTTYVKSYKKQYQSCEKEKWSTLKKDIVLPRMIGFLQNLARSNYGNFASNAYEMISYDYMYLCLEEQVDSSFQKRIDFVEKNSLDTYPNQFLSDTDYMYAVLESFLDKKSAIVSHIKEEEAELILEKTHPIGYAKIKEYLY